VIAKRNFETVVEEQAARGVTDVFEQCVVRAITGHSNFVRHLFEERPPCRHAEFDGQSRPDVRTTAIGSGRESASTSPGIVALFAGYDRIWSSTADVPCGSDM
jgi:hypothetical protein